jgi:hypothetical protein
MRAFGILTLPNKVLAPCAVNFDSHFPIKISTAFIHIFAVTVTRERGSIHLLKLQVPLQLSSLQYVHNCVEVRENRQR